MPPSFLRLGWFRLQNQPFSEDQSLSSSLSFGKPPARRERAFDGASNEAELRD